MSSTVQSWFKERRARRYCSVFRPSPAAPLLRRPAAELNQTGLVRMQGQRKLRQPIPQFCLKPLGIGLVFKAPGPSAADAVILPKVYNWRISSDRRRCEWDETHQDGAGLLGLTAGGNRIRTIGPAEKETAVERGPAADHRRLARRPVLNDPIQLIGPASLVGNSRETFHKSGTDGSNPISSSGESGELPYCAAGQSATFRSLAGLRGARP
jgi:hypothetical protein